MKKKNSQAYYKYNKLEYLLIVVFIVCSKDRLEEK